MSLESATAERLWVCAAKEENVIVKEIMTSDPACCSPDSTLKDVARLMVDHDCGEIPVVQNRKPIGVITDRDIAIRTVAVGKNPVTMKASECMSSPVITVKPDTSLDECCQTMERHQIRRVLVVDSAGVCCGIVAQADIANAAPPHETAEVVREISHRTSGSMSA
jgi:CBS domain-containing protein